MYVLPIEESPIFKTYAFWGDYLSILQGNGYDVSGFVYNNFFILSYFMIGNRFGFTAGYKLRKFFIKEIFGEIPEDFLQLLKEKIMLNKYAILTLNQSKIENIEYDFWHDWLIYGFNEQNRSILAIGYANCKGLSVFKTREFSYEEFLSLLPPKGSRQGARGRYYDNQFLWIPNDLKLEALNLKKIKRNLFRLNKNLIYPWENQSVYRIFYYANSLMIINHKKAFDLRPLKSISEHKRMIKALISDSCNDKRILEEYSEIVKMAERMLIIAAKYNFEQKFDYEKKRNCAVKINRIFKELCYKEKLLFVKLYENLKGVQDV